MPKEVVETYGSHCFLVDGTITGVAFSGDGKLVAAGARGRDGGTVTVWDREGLEQAYFRTASRVVAIGFCDRDRLLVALAPPQQGREPPPDAPSLYAWRLPEREPVAVPQDLGKDCSLLAASPASRSIAVCEPPDNAPYRSTVTLVDTADWSATASWESAQLCGMTFSPDGRELALVGYGSVMFQPVDPLREPREYPVGERSLSCLAYSQDGKRLVVSGRDGVTVRDRSFRVLRKIRDAPRQLPPIVTPRLRATPAPRFISAVAISPDCRTVYCTHNQFGPQAYDVETGSEVKLDRPSISGFDGMALSPDGEDLAVWGDSMRRFAQLMRLREGGKVLGGDRRAVGYELALSPDGRYLLAGSGLLLLGMPEGERIRSLERAGTRRASAFGPDGKSLVVGHDRSQITIYHAPAFGRHKTFDVVELKEGEAKGKYGYVSEVAFSRDGRRLFASAYLIGGPAYVVQYRTSDWSRLGSATINSREACSLAVTPDGTHVAVGTVEATVELWAADRMAHVRTFPCPFRPGAPRNHYVWDVEFSPDGALLAAPTYDGLVHIWDVASGRERHALDVGRRAWDIEFSPDGSCLLVGGDTFSVWDLGAPNRPMLSLPLRSDVRSVSPPPVNAEGTRVVLGLENGLGYLVELELP
ncbi:MAG: WD40 repeat domain-containing protein [Planctomycetota bacterium]